MGLVRHRKALAPPRPGSHQSGLFLYHQRLMVEAVALLLRMSLTS